MSRNLLPFLYQTWTLQFTCRRPATLLFAQKAALSTQNKRFKRVDNSIPFEWDDEDHLTGDDAAEQQGTLTPTETEIFKNIFDEISQGRLPKAKKRPQSAEEGRANETAKDARDTTREQQPGDSLVEQARGAQFGDEFLSRYPTSLRKAAKTALGKFELAPARPKLREMTELDEAEAKQMAEWAHYEKIREQEKERVQGLMDACETDTELWKVMEEEVFSLPGKLGIVQEAPKKKRKSKKKAEPVEERVMDVHGPLYSHYLSTGLNLFDTAFPKPSLLAFNILPRIKELGLSSYVLGVSTPLFAKLAEIHWRRFGDATSALDALDEMKSVGLYPNQEVEELVQQIGEHLHSCTWGAQGPFVMAMMETPPYDAGLATRLRRIEASIAKSQMKRQEA